MAAEGDFWGLEEGERVPLREPVLVEEPLPDMDTVCVPERDTTGLLVRVAAPEVLFDTDTDAVWVVELVLVREAVCDSVVVVVPEEERDTEALSDHSALVEACAEPV